MNSSKVVLIIHDVRSTHNVGSMLRTADGLGVEKVFLTGYTPYPETKDDKRLPHLRAKITNQIKKTALGAENSVNWEYSPDVSSVIDKLRETNYLIAALEQTPVAINLVGFKSQQNIALIVGNEVDGIELSILHTADKHLEIPMLGKKESLNVSVAAAIALYHIKSGL